MGTFPQMASLIVLNYVPVFGTFPRIQVYMDLLQTHGFPLINFQIVYKTFFYKIHFLYYTQVILLTNSLVFPPFSFIFPTSGTFSRSNHNIDSLVTSIDFFLNDFLSILFNFFSLCVIFYINHLVF